MNCYNRFHFNLGAVNQDKKPAWRMFYENGNFTEPMWGDKHGVVDCFMCKTDFDHELGQAHEGVTLYPSMESLMKRKPCVKECGIVHVGVAEKGKSESDRIVRPISVFMERIAFDYELGGAITGNKVYPTEEDMVKGEIYGLKYGSVLVDVFLIKVIAESDFSSYRFVSDSQRIFWERQGRVRKNR